MVLITKYVHKKSSVTSTSADKSIDLLFSLINSTFAVTTVSWKSRCGLNIQISLSNQGPCFHDSRFSITVVASDVAHS